MKKFTAALIFVSVLFADLALAQVLPKATPAELGFSPARLNKIAELMKEDTSKKVIPGAVILIARHGKIAMFDAEGMLDPAKTTPMSTDAIFRIYSMSKPITSVTA